MVFLWFLSKSKILTRDNVAKRQALVDTTCLSCSDFESVHHLFFDCVVAKQMWLQLVHVVNLNKVYNFEAVAEFWLSERKHVVLNVCSAAAMWSLWKLRNSLCFQNGRWRGMWQIWRSISIMLKNWELIYPVTWSNTRWCWTSWRS